MKTYADIIKILEGAEKENGLFVAVIYPTDRHEWLPVDITEYLRQLKQIDKPQDYPYPCFFEIENDGDMYIHPKGENS